jgi:thiol-disulfide isomerase/thioredoxin
MHIKIDNSKEIKKLRLADNNVVGKKDTILLVHAKWCGHCRDLVDSPSPGKASIWTQFKNKNPNINIIEVEYEALPMILSDKQRNSPLKQVIKKAVNGYPSISKVSTMSNNTIDVHMYDQASRSLPHLQTFVKTYFRKN